MSHFVRKLVGLAFSGLGCICAQAGESVKPIQPKLEWLRSVKSTEPVKFVENAKPSNSSPAPTPMLLTFVSTPEPSSTETSKLPQSSLILQSELVQSSTSSRQQLTPQLTPKDLSIQKWSILLNDKTLYRTLRRWTQEAQYQLLWQVDRDYPVEAEITFDTTLREAVSQVMSGVALTDYPLQAIFNPTTRVLRVVRHMDENSR
jgi:hypothetical protein